MKTVYIAGKVNKSESSMEQVAEIVEDQGYRIIFKWWEHQKGIKQPYLDHKINSDHADRMLKAAYDCDVFILFCDKSILGAAIEFGVALASRKHTVDKKLIVVGARSTRQSIFYTHEWVINVEAFSGLADL